jgi:hypothetical protein
MCQHLINMFECLLFKSMLLEPKSLKYRLKLHFKRSFTTYLNFIAKNFVFVILICNYVHTNTKL